MNCTEKKTPKKQKQTKKQTKHKKIVVENRANPTLDKGTGEARFEIL